MFSIGLAFRVQVHFSIEFDSNWNFASGLSFINVSLLMLTGLLAILNYTNELSLSLSHKTRHGRISSS